MIECIKSICENRYRNFAVRRGEMIRCKSKYLVLDYTIIRQHENEKLLFNVSLDRKGNMDISPIYKAQTSCTIKISDLRSYDENICIFSAYMKI